MSGLKQYMDKAAEAEKDEDEDEDEDGKSPPPKAKAKPKAAPKKAESDKPEDEDEDGKHEPMAACPPADVARACNAAGAAHLAPLYIERALTKPQLEAALAEAATLKDMCRRAGADSEFARLSLGSLDAARRELFEIMAARQAAPTTSRLPAGPSEADMAGASAVAASWDRVVEKINARTATTLGEPGPGASGWDRAVARANAGRAG